MNEQGACHVGYEKHAFAKTTREIYNTLAFYVDEKILKVGSKADWKTFDIENQVQKEWLRFRRMGSFLFQVEGSADTAYNLIAEHRVQTHSWIC